MSDKPRVLVIGGMRKNVPAWAEAAFEIDLLAQDGPKSRIERPERQPAAIVVYTAAVSHQHSGQAYEMGSDWDVPVLPARNGWSTAVEQAARIGAAWFVNAVQAGSQAIAAKNEPLAEEGLEAVNNAWRDLAEQEAEKREALERRLRKLQNKLDKAAGVIERLRSGAEERVVAEIRRRAAEVREARVVLSGDRAELATIACLLRAALNECGPRLEQVELRLQDGVNSDTK